MVAVVTKIALVCSDFTDAQVAHGMVIKGRVRDFLNDIKFVEAKNK